MTFEAGWSAAIEMAAKVLDAYREYDTNLCCGGQECGCMGATVHDEIRHYIRSLTLPSDLVAVPREPTQEMTMAGFATYSNFTGSKLEAVSAIYRAMLAAHKEG